MSEDCLYLNVWTPARSGGRGFPFSSTSSAAAFKTRRLRAPLRRENMARKGIVAVSINYRTNIFGFFVHPELTRNPAPRIRQLRFAGPGGRPQVGAE